MEKNPKLTAQAKREIKALRLEESERYNTEFARLVEAYGERPPFGVPERNMVRALRLMTWQNTAEDWARLHVCEAFLKARKTSK